jgi:signal transduction histidine kinase
VETEVEFRAALEHPLDCILSDYELPNFSGIDALRVLQESGLDVPFIVVSGAIGEETAVAAMRAGAHDYIMKDNLARLGPAIARELHEVEIRRDRRRVAASLETDRTVAAALGRVGQELIPALGSGQLLPRLCKVVTEVMACDYCHTLLWQREADVYSVVATHGHPAAVSAPLQALPIPKEIMTDSHGRPWHTATSFTVWTSPPTAPGMARLMRQFGITHSLFMPLRRGTDLVGFQVAGYCNREGSFSPIQHRIAEAVGQVASMALEHAHTVDELTRANALKSDFVATISHELRTPLNIIIGYSDLLLDGSFGPLTAEQLSPLHHTARNARELLALISATLDLSRLEKGQFHLNCTRVDLLDLLRTLEIEHREWSRKPGVQFRLNVSPMFPPIYTDQLVLKMVLQNLVSNALKFTTGGTVIVSARVQDETVEVSVTDTGIGIAPEHQAIVFQAFRQIEPHLTRRHGGVGLGLYLGRRLLDMMGGTITLESQVGHGSTFRVWLPLGSNNHARSPSFDT